ncbi:MAG: DUF2071 domain-containing protein [Chloroflexota bacterium]
MTANVTLPSTDQDKLAGAQPLAARLLERALLITILAHAAAMGSMALLLLPGMPGGSNPLAARVAYIAMNPWLWRLGWLPWQITALSDLLIALALFRTAWIPCRAAIFVVITTLIAFLIEQPGEFSWITRGVALAQTAQQTGNLAPYLLFESRIYLQIAGWAAAIYTIAAIGWSWCFYRAKIWHRGLTGLSIVTWAILIAVSIAPLLPDAYRPSDGIVAAGNAIGFAFMMIWFCAITELVLRRSRPNSPTGRMALWIYPRRNLLGYLLNGVANSRLARAFGEWIPSIAFISNITNVIYVNYLVEAERLAPLVPWGMELQRLGADGKWALFTHLTYQHGHFGPQMLGPLRRLMPSPVQSNWRIYVRDPQTQRSGIYFVTTAINKTLPALLARLLSEGIPMHLLLESAVIAKPDGSFEICLNPGAGSAPDLRVTLESASQIELNPLWTACFETFHDLLAYCVPQDRAMSSQTWYQRVTRQEIELGIPLEVCEPLMTTGLVSEAARMLVGDAQTVCFRVPQVTLRFTLEEHDLKPKRQIIASAP